MLDIKAIKVSDSRPSKLYLWWIDTKFSKWYYDFTWKFIQNPIFQIKRLWDWYWAVFRYDYDFDGHCLFRIIEYKLKRLEKVLLNGLAVQDPKDMKALKLAIKLAGRLKEDNYEIAFHDRHDKKWGKRVRGRGNTWTSDRPKANTPKKKEQEKKEYWDMIHAAEAQKKREEKIFYGILLKYLRNLWD
jgi:hypothetical protein